MAAGALALSAVPLAVTVLRPPLPQITGTPRSVGWVVGQPGVFTFSMDLSRRGGVPSQHFRIELLDSRTKQPIPLGLEDLLGSELGPDGGPLVFTGSQRQMATQPLTFHVRVIEYYRPAWWRRYLPDIGSLREEIGRITVECPPVHLPAPGAR